MKKNFPLLNEKLLPLFDKNNSFKQNVSRAVSEMLLTTHEIELTMKILVTMNYDVIILNIKEQIIEIDISN